MSQTWAGIVFSANYTDVKAFGDGFVAVSDGGDIMFTDSEGTPSEKVHVDRFNATSVAVVNGVVYVAGKEGRLYSVSDGKYRLVESVDTEINALTVLGNILFAACNQGKVLVLDTSVRNAKPRVVATGTGQNLIDITAGADRCFALTSQGLILSSVDGKEWSRFDFNQNYADYYDTTVFTCISASENSLYIAGVAEDGYPRVYTSVKGTVWSQRGLSFTKDGAHLELDAMPLGMCYEPLGDRYVMSCTDGVLFFMPGCTHCNSAEYRLAGDLNSVAFNGRNCLVAGEGDYLE